MPDPTNPPIIGLIIFGSLSLITAIGNYWHNEKPNMFTLYLELGGTTSFFLAWGIYGIRQIFSSWILLTVLICVYVLIWALPFLLSDLSRNMYKEIMAPKSRITKIMMIIFCALIGGSGMGGAITGRALIRLLGVYLAMGIFGIEMYIFCIILALLFSYQAWENYCKYRVITTGGKRDV
jgi:hypothetical protein